MPRAALTVSSTLPDVLDVLSILALSIVLDTFNSFSILTCFIPEGAEEYSPYPTVSPLGNGTFLTPTNLPPLIIFSSVNLASDNFSVGNFFGIRPVSIIDWAALIPGPLPLGVVANGLTSSAINSKFSGVTLPLSLLDIVSFRYCVSYASPKVSFLAAVTWIALSSSFCKPLILVSASIMPTGSALLDAISSLSISASNAASIADSSANSAPTALICSRSKGISNIFPGLPYCVGSDTGPTAYE